MANGLKLLKQNKNLVVIGLLSLCLLVWIVFMTGLLGGTTDPDPGTEPSSTQGNSNRKEEYDITQGDESGSLTDSQHAQSQSVIDDPATGVLEGDTLAEELHSEVSSSYTTDELKNVRDPFQSLLRKPQSSSKASSRSLEGPKEDHLTHTVPSGGSKTGLKPVVSTPGKSSSNQAKSETESAPLQPEIRFPTFVLNGIVSQAGVQKAILASKGHSYIIGKGEHIQEWVVEEITQTGVRVVNEIGQRFMITFEGVTMDEGKK